jgi:peptidoglycan hydrolase-like protein with peptidoglycan-binding domain
MSKWKSVLTLTVAAAMVAATAFAQSGNSGSKAAPGAKQPDAGAPSTSPSTDASKPDTSSPSASPSTSDKPATSTEKAPDTSTSGPTPSASPGTSTTDPAKSDSMKSDSMKSDTMKSEKMTKGRMGAAAGGNREQVKAAQQALKDKGHDPGAIDGVMGPKTRTALKDFQKKEGMKDTGRLDQETMTKLGVEAKTSSTSQAPGSASPATSSPSASPSDSSAAEKKDNSGATEKK